MILSRTSELTSTSSLTVTSLHGPFFFLADGPYMTYIHSSFNLSTMATFFDVPKVAVVESFKCNLIKLKYVVEATLEIKCTVSVCVFKTTITQVMLSVLSLFILFPVVFHVALVYNYFYP